MFFFPCLFFFTTFLLAQTVVTNPASPWTVPAGVSSVTVEVWGGGGGGGGAAANVNGSAGGGGGGGGFARSVLSVSEGQTYTITYGSGGPGGGTGGGNGTTGGTSTFTGTGGTVSASGGIRGLGATVSTASGGAGGSGSGTVNFSGGSGAGGYIDGSWDNGEAVVAVQVMPQMVRMVQAHHQGGLAVQVAQAARTTLLTKVERVEIAIREPKITVALVMLPGEAGLEREHGLQVIPVVQGLPGRWCLPIL